MPPYWMRIVVLTTLAVQITVFWGVTLCSLVDRYQHFRGTFLSWRWSQWVHPKFWYLSN